MFTKQSFWITNCLPQLRNLRRMTVEVACVLQRRPSQLPRPPRFANSPQIG